ncbi:unnamed protein product [Calypogeia fissa]
MATTPNENIDSNETPGFQLLRIAKVSSLPPTLTLRSKRMVLKTPTPEDDFAMCEIVSDPLTVQYLPHFHRSGGWTLEEMAQRREKLMAAQGENKGLTVFIHIWGNKGENNGTEESRIRLNEEDEDLTLAGTTGFSAVNLQDGTCEIGIILHHLYWRQGFCTEALYLCLRYAFEVLGLQRVDWVTSVGNKDMRGWCEDLLQMKPFDLMTDNLGPSVGYSLSLSEWQSSVCHFLEQKVSSRCS